jgi:hypothetical protein
VITLFNHSRVPACSVVGMDQRMRKGDDFPQYPTNSCRLYVFSDGECQPLACELLVDLMKKGVYSFYTWMISTVVRTPNRNPRARPRHDGGLKPNTRKFGSSHGARGHR